MFSGREEHFYVWTKKVENYVSGVFPNVRGAVTFAAESQDVVTAATVALGVPELVVETSAEIDGQLFVVLSALTEGESFDIVMSAGGDHGFENWRKLHEPTEQCGTSVLKTTKQNSDECRIENSLNFLWEVRQVMSFLLC